MKVQVFAGLKEYFDASFNIDNNVQDISDLKQQLISLNPSSAALLESCRFAVNDEFIDDDFTLDANASIIVLPPSSGG